MDKVGFELLKDWRIRGNKEINDDNLLKVSLEMQTLVHHLSKKGWSIAVLLQGVDNEVHGCMCGSVKLLSQNWDYILKPFDSTPVFHQKIDGPFVCGTFGKGALFEEITRQLNRPMSEIESTIHDLEEALGNRGESFIAGRRLRENEIQIGEWSNPGLRDVLKKRYFSTQPTTGMDAPLSFAERFRIRENPVLRDTVIALGLPDPVTYEPPVPFPLNVQEDMMAKIQKIDRRRNGKSNPTGVEVKPPTVEAVATPAQIQVPPLVVYRDERLDIIDCTKYPEWQQLEPIVENPDGSRLYHVDGYRWAEVHTDWWSPRTGDIIVYKGKCYPIVLPPGHCKPDGREAPATQTALLQEAGARVLNVRATPILFRTNGTAICLFSLHENIKLEFVRRQRREGF